MRTHDRPEMSDGEEPALMKRMKRSHISSASNPAVLADPSPHFAPDLLSPANIHKLSLEYNASEPYKYCRVEHLVQGALFDQIRRKLWGGPVHRAMQDRVAIAILGLHVKDH